MPNNKVDKIQTFLDKITRQWWFYLSLTLLFFIPSYASKGYDPQFTSPFIKEVLSNAFLYDFSTLFPIAKIFTILLVIAVLLFGKKIFIQIIFSAYVSILYLFLAVFQHTAITEQYGFGVIIGNIILVSIVALFWVWEIIAGKNDFSRIKMKLWKLWTIPLSVFAFYFPVNPETISPDFSIGNVIFNESALTYCMMTPVILTIILIYYPKINKPLLRVTSYAGVIFGMMNILTWFVMIREYWWMGVMHLPLLLISLFCFVISLGKKPIIS